MDQKLIVAFGTDDGKTLKGNDHFGMSKYFYVYEFINGKEKFIEKRENLKYKGDESIKHGDPLKAKATSSVLKNVDVIVGRRFGPNIKRLLQKFVCVLLRVDTIEEAIGIINKNLVKIIEKQNKTEKRKTLIFKS